MLVLNLSCANGHLFEGWFGSNDDFESQQGRAMLSCPLCGVDEVTRMPSAPRLNVSHLREGSSRRGTVPQTPSRGHSTPERQAAPAAVAAATNASDSVPLPEQAQWMQLVAHVLKHTEDVGDQFAEEARRIHYGESEERGIRGSATAEDTAALLDEGIEVMPLPLPAARKGPLQ